MTTESLEAIHHDCDSQALATLLDTQISTASQQLRSLETQESSLSDNLTELTAKAGALDRRLEAIPQTDGYTGVSVFFAGTFFEQLRTVERQLEAAENEKSGFAAVLRSLRSDVTAFTARNRRLLTQLTQLRDQSGFLSSQEASRRDELVAKYSELECLTQERDGLKRLCEDIKARILETVTQMQECSPAVIARLTAQKAELEAQLQAEKQTLKQTAQERKAAFLKSSADSAKRAKDTEQAMSPIRWAAERSALLAKVKKAKQELSVVGSRERSATKTAKKADTIAYDADEVKMAIVREIGSIPKSPPQFLFDALEAEQQYEETQRRQIAEIETVERRVAEFKVTHSAIIGSDENNAVNAERIALLMDELKSIRSSL